MLEKLSSPGFEAQSKAATEVIDLAQIIKAGNEAPIFAEVGVGIGATTVELLHVLDGSGDLHLFDFVDKVTELASDVKLDGTYKGVTLHTHGNSRRTYNSYAWTLAQFISSLHRKGQPTKIFDLVYIHGLHLFHHDAAACAILKDMIRPGGYIVLDDMQWTIDGSPSMNPKKRADTRKEFSDEQIRLSHMSLIAEAVLATDARFERDKTRSKSANRTIFKMKQG